MHDQPHKHSLQHWFSGLTEDPSLGRLLLRRVIPVALGISAYAVLKRSAYVAIGGPMTPITDNILKSGAAGNTKTFLQNAWREGGATTMFFAVWAFTETLGDAFDKYFGDKAKELTPQQQQNHQQLLGQLNARYMQPGLA
jgi:uncharacterized protein (DUF697 family)